MHNRRAALPCNAFRMLEFDELRFPFVDPTLVDSSPSAIRGTCSQFEQTSIPTHHLSKQILYLEDVDVEKVGEQESVVRNDFTEGATFNSIQHSQLGSVQSDRLMLRRMMLLLTFHLLSKRSYSL